MNLLSSLEATSPVRLLPPCAATVLALAEAVRSQARPPSAAELRSDPGAWALALCDSDDADSPYAQCHRLFAQLAARPRFGFADWTADCARLAYRAAALTGRIARLLADQIGLPGEEMEALGCFVHLGRLVQTQESDAQLSRLEPYKLTRLLARRWPWPAWLREPLLAFDPKLPCSGSEAAAFRRNCLLASLALVQEKSSSPPLGIPGSADSHLEPLGLDARRLPGLEAVFRDLPTPPAAIASDAGELLRRALRLLPAPEADRSAEMLVRLDDELESMQRRLADAEADAERKLRDQKLEALAEFAAGAGHEINNPLAVISAQAQHLLKSEESLERGRALERIIAQAQRIHLLLRDLMTFARPPEPRLTVVKAEALIDAALRQTAEQALARDLTVTKGSKFAGLKLKADPELLGAALTCLVRNAIAAAPAGGWVRISLAEAEPGSLTLVVEDNGPGVSPEAARQIFDPFFSGKSAGRGVGLGLPKAWRIARLHGGRLTLDSQPGQPTRFCLTLPLHAAALKLPKRSASRRPAPRRARLRPAAKRRGR